MNGSMTLEELYQAVKKMYETEENRNKPVQIWWWDKDKQVGSCPWNRGGRITSATSVWKNQSETTRMPVIRVEEIKQKVILYSGFTEELYDWLGRIGVMCLGSFRSGYVAVMSDWFDCHPYAVIDVEPGWFEENYNELIIVENEEQFRKEVELVMEKYVGDC